MTAQMYTFSNCNYTQLQLKEIRGVHSLHGSDMCTRRKTNDTPSMRGEKMQMDLGEMQTNLLEEYLQHNSMKKSLRHFHGECSTYCYCINSKKG
jgi:hypothetical protein